jgi:predicted lipid-binding transport protein (Tim44 family)
MFEQSSQLVGLGVGGLGGGLGIAGYKSWIIALVILLVLVGLARWTMRPARRAARAQRRTGELGAEITPPTVELDGADGPRAKQTRRAP